MRSALHTRRQNGLSLIAVLLLGALLVIVVTIAMRVVPSALEYQSVRKALNLIAASGVTTAAEIQRAFERQASIDDITSVKGTDILIDRVGGKLVLSVRYEKRVPLFGPVSLLIDYEGSSSQ
jgi:hypothetical protein